MARLGRKFYTRDTLTTAQALLGNYLVRKIGRKFLVGKIVETEAYIGPRDKASHAYKWKITPRNKTEYLEGGHIYIYLCYGMYWQLNITTSSSGKPECVLIRALEPILQSYKNPKSQIPNHKQITNYKFQNYKQLKKMTSGPGKLCRWLKLDKSFDGEDLVKSKRIWLQKGEKIKSVQIVASKRIGIDYAGSWKHKLWRFSIKDNLCVSKI